METLISLNPNEIFRLPAGSRWECIGGAGWLTQHGTDIALRCGSRIAIDDRAGAVIEALGGPIRLRLAEPVAPYPLLRRVAKVVQHGI
ncbi:hypothetical protein [Pseudogulbenkiania sp. MAI-1]|uniref:hypothetical protein n=1 Tax=Pseudogulbenkiania sp. MAI-1 TaxID=990370 RepID=UPI00045EB8FD|nr:hypothetical protein [Pseudogulbenkiania sp. MAI-1]